MARPRTPRVAAKSGQLRYLSISTLLRVDGQRLVRVAWNRHRPGDEREYGEIEAWGVAKVAGDYQLFEALPEALQALGPAALRADAAALAEAVALELGLSRVGVVIPGSLTASLVSRLPAPLLEKSTLSFCHVVFGTDGGRRGSRIRYHLMQGLLSRTAMRLKQGGRMPPRSPARR